MNDPAYMSHLVLMNTSLLPSVHFEGQSIIFCVQFKEQIQSLATQLGHLPDDQVNCHHAPYTRTLKQVVVT